MGVRFGTYATFWVRAAITHALHEQTRVVRLPSKVHVTYNKIKRATDQLSVSSPSPTDDAVAEELRRSGLALSPQRIRNVIRQIKTRPKSLDMRLAGSSLGGSENDGTALVDIVEDRSSQRVEAKVVQSMLRADLIELMRKHLRTDEARVLTLRFGLHLDLGEFAAGFFGPAGGTVEGRFVEALVELAAEVEDQRRFSRCRARGEREARSSAVS